jgi:hypothetical protein
LENVTTSQREMDRVYREWASRAGWPAMVPRADTRAEADTAEKPRDAEKLREEVAVLRERLRALEERLEKRKSESKP